MTIHRVTHLGKKQKLTEIDETRYQQILSAMEYLVIKHDAKIVTKVDEEKRIITLKEEYSELLTLEVYDFRNETRYYYSESA